ncbi:hypothetical protein [Nitrosomonas sp. Nm33]|uniref:hypothetical protein n=1 Tax=Nitrosomonas sp. Nm33 TaxID=133724 RepID=UPI000898C80B|nr:hypothetical protein [Nitrosomonas sp. Nm33]SDY46950.1 hypothetical protein SAMN05421755_102418 [Nitrosomonas sp. Nm33]
MFNELLLKSCLSTTFSVGIIYAEYIDIHNFIISIRFQLLNLDEENCLKEILARYHSFPIQSRLKDKESLYQQVKKIFSSSREFFHCTNRKIDSHLIFFYKLNFYYSYFISITYSCLKKIASKRY